MKRLSQGGLPPLPPAPSLPPSKADTAALDNTVLCFVCKVLGSHALKKNSHSLGPWWGTARLMTGLFRVTPVFPSFPSSSASILQSGGVSLRAICARTATLLPRFSAPLSSNTARRYCGRELKLLLLLRRLGRISFGPSCKKSNCTDFAIAIFRDL